jgi:hypothetical protein
MKNITYDKNVIIWGIILFIFISFLIAYYQNMQNNKPVGQVIEHTVRQGEHLDDIANKYYPNTYVLKARADIKNINNMTTSDIYEGQVIKVRKVK